MTGASRAADIAVVAELSAVMPVRDIVASGGPAGVRMAARGLRNMFRLASESQATRRPPAFIAARSRSNSWLMDSGIVPGPVVAKRFN
jgi:hypothetical protein